MDSCGAGPRRPRGLALSSVPATRERVRAKDIWHTNRTLTAARIPTTRAGPARWHSVHRQERGGEFLPARASELFVATLEVVFDGSDRDAQFAGYLLVRATGGSQQRRLLLGPSELRPDIDGDRLGVTGFSARSDR